MIPTKTPRPAMGADSLILLAQIAHDLAPQVRASSGLATALLALYSAKLEDAEGETARLGRSCNGIDGSAYARQVYRTRELRGLVAILDSLELAMKKAEGRANRIAEMIGRCVKRGAQ